MMNDGVVVLMVVVQAAANVLSAVGVRRNYHHRLSVSGGDGGDIAGWRKR